MKHITTILTVFAFLMPACEESFDEDIEDIEEVEFRGALNHPSGICRIESETGFSHKRVKYFHKDKPNLEHARVYCDPWVGTAECCKDKNYWGLSYDQCAQLRNVPDCPKQTESGGGGGGNQQPK